MNNQAMEARQEKILNILSNQGITSVLTLSQTLGVTRETIRKDLRSLENGGKVKRIHGAATLRDGAANMPFSLRETLAEDEKRQVAHIASAYIQKEDTIIIEGSTTTYFLCEDLMAEKTLAESLTVITNSIRVAQLFQMGEKCRALYLLGGYVDREEGCTRGKFGVDMLDSFKAGKAFISAAAIGEDFSVTAFKEEDMLFQRKAILCAEKTFVLANKSKLFHSALFNVCNLNDIYAFVSNAVLAPSLMEILRAKQVEFIQA